MFIGEVVGSVVATRKTASMDGLPLRLVRKVSIENQPGESYLVVVDPLGTSSGERVLVAAGSTARQTSATDNRPIDAIIMAIVDTWQTGGQVHYSKNAPLTLS
jgi:ethanolamine utilization protein EutN